MSFRGGILHEGGTEQSRGSRIKASPFRFLHWAFPSDSPTSRCLWFPSCPSPPGFFAPCLPIARHSWALISEVGTHNYCTTNNNSKMLMKDTIKGSRAYIPGNVLINSLGPTCSEARDGCSSLATPSTQLWSCCRQAQQYQIPTANSPSDI